MPRKLGLGIDVSTAARQRIAWTFDTFERVYLSFSGGKDSTVMLHLAAEECRRRGVRMGLLFVDLEAQYRLTIEHVERCFADYADVIDPYWIALPLHLRNAVSQFEPHWLCFDPEQKSKWVRCPPTYAITDENRFSWFRRGMEFEEFVPAFGHHFAGGKLTACMVGIRSDESLNRWRTLAMKKTRLENKSWTTWIDGSVWNVYPIYDWRTEDLWTWHARTPGVSRNELYDRMHMAGLTIHQMRICQPYGDDQRKGLWLYQLIEPETWGKVVARVVGANSGALYAQERGNINGTIRIEKPNGLTWKEFAELLLVSMPPPTAEHYRNKIAVFVQWWSLRGYPSDIPDEADPKIENTREAPTWRRICKAILRNDYWCKGLSFTQTKSDAYDRYRKLMKKRRASWGR